jgi:NAD(P)-dependent dehydrogenase (short-subunit alcohol dehydrogenase family)
MGSYVVTGAASGIGAATAKRLKNDGHRVVGVDRQPADVVADLSTPDGRTLAIEGVRQLVGESLDGIVTCAGVGPIPSREGSLIVSLNYFGTLAFLEGLRPLLEKGHNPAAVAISSNSTTAQPGVPAALCDLCLDGDEDAARRAADEMGPMVAYPASKLALARWVRQNAPGPTWIGAGITLNAIAPGMIDTAMIAEGKADPEIGPLLEQFPIPAGRMGQAQEMAAFITFLLSAEARFFCGSVLFADGGTDALCRPNDWPALWQPS